MWEGLEEDISELFAGRGFEEGDRLLTSWKFRCHDPSAGSLWLSGHAEKALSAAQHYLSKAIREKAQKDAEVTESLRRARALKPISENSLWWGTPEYYRERYRRIYRTPQWLAKRAAQEKARRQKLRGNPEWAAKRREYNARWWAKLSPEKKAEILANRAARTKERRRKAKNVG